MIIPSASPTGQMGGGSFNPAFPLMGKSVVRSVDEIRDHKYEIFLATTTLTPAGWWVRGGAGVGAVVLWKLRQLGLLLTLDYSSGGGGPGESPTSTEGLLKQGQPGSVVVPAASNSAHGGRRSGSKPRKKCPPGYIAVWSKRKGDFVCKRATPDEIWRKG